MPIATLIPSCYRKKTIAHKYLPPKIELRPGQKLGGKYVLDRMIGKGGMGVVWAGTNESTGKRVALKVLRRAFDSTSETAQLFRREATVASRVNHPNVVTIFDIIDHEQTTWIVMELLDGEPLNEYLAREGPLSIEQAAALLLPAMRGVAAANAQGVVHRDLKPHNIFLCVGPDGRMVTTKVLDFGNSFLMESVPGSPIEASQLATIGTPAYMAPEHIAGTTRHDERVDVYGFGVVLYEALAGRHPFPGEPGPELLSRIMHDPPPPLASLRPDLPNEVLGIVERAMAKDPEARFPNLDPFIRLLEDHVLPVTPLPRSMTPLAGVPIMPLVENHSGIADAVVQVRRRSEDSQFHETRVLYPRGSAAATPPPLVKPHKPETLRETPIGKPPTRARTFRNLLGRPAVHGILFGAVIAFVIWLACPMPAGTNAQKTASPSVAPVPAVAPPVPHSPPGLPPVDSNAPAPAPAPAANSIYERLGQTVPGPEAGSQPSEDVRPTSNSLTAGEGAAKTPRRPSHARADQPAANTRMNPALSPDAKSSQPSADVAALAPALSPTPPEPITPPPPSSSPSPREPATDPTPPRGGAATSVFDSY